MKLVKTKPEHPYPSWSAGPTLGEALNKGPVRPIETFWAGASAFRKLFMEPRHLISSIYELKFLHLVACSISSLNLSDSYPVGAGSAPVDRSINHHRSSAVS